MNDAGRVLSMIELFTSETGVPVQQYVIAYSDWFGGTPSADFAPELAAATGLEEREIPVTGDVYSVITEDSLQEWQARTPYSCVLSPDFELIGCTYGHTFDPVFESIASHAGL